MFTASVCRIPALAKDDPLRDWIERVRGLYGGLGHHEGLQELYGLEQRELDPPLFQKPDPTGGGIFKRNTGPASTRGETEKITRKA
jgi:hypothetical protein